MSTQAVSDIVILPAPATFLNTGVKSTRMGLTERLHGDGDSWSTGLYSPWQVRLLVYSWLSWLDTIIAF